MGGQFNLDLKHFAGNHPYVLTLILVLILVVIGLTGSAVIAVFKLSGETTQVPRILIEDTLRGLVAVLLLQRLGWWKAAGYTRPRRLSDLRLFWVPLVPVALNPLAGGGTDSLSNIVLFLIIALLVGFVEETYFRGLILHILAAQGVRRAAVVSAVLFGLVHSLNILVGWNPQYVLQQVLFATSVGFMYAALALRTGIIWPLVIIHAATDFAAFLITGGLLPPLSSPGRITALDIFVWLAFISYGVFLLARRRNEIPNDELNM